MRFRNQFRVFAVAVAVSYCSALYGGDSGPTTQKRQIEAERADAKRRAEVKRENGKLSEALLRQQEFAGREARLRQWEQLRERERALAASRVDRYQRADAHQRGLRARTDSHYRELQRR